MVTADTTPLPGSDEAIEAGCVCPVIDNGHGSMELAQDRGGFWHTDACPIHGTNSSWSDPVAVESHKTGGGV